MHVTASGPLSTVSSQELSLSDSANSSDSSKPELKKKVFFPRVKEAREALKEMAMDLLHLQVQLIKDAAASGDHESATKANQWLIEHVGAEDGVRIIDPSASKPKEIEKGSSGPAIQIGIALGGVRGSLPEAHVIDVTPVKLNE